VTEPSVLAALLPSGVAVFEAWTPDVEGDLLPEELGHVVRAVPKRVEEFRLGRVCARRALARLGATPAAIGVHTTRAPRWPAGTVGSITHCAGFCAAAVGWATDILAVGIDAEPNQPLPDGVLAGAALDLLRAAVRLRDGELLERAAGLALRTAAQEAMPAVQEEVRASRGALSPAIGA